MSGLHSLVPRAVLLFALCCLMLLAGATSADARAATGPTVDILSVAGPIDTTVVRYIDGALKKAAAEGVEVVVLELDSSAVGNVDLEEALSPLLDRKVPVAVWVGPPGARATGGAAWLAAAGDVLAVAPGSLVGAATVGPTTTVASQAEPADAQRDGGGDSQGIDGQGVDGQGVDGQGVDGQGEAEGVQQVRDALARRGLLERAVLVTRDAGLSLPEDAALPRGLSADDVVVDVDSVLLDRGAVDIVAMNLQETLSALDGRSVTLNGAAFELDVDPVTANVRFNNQGLWGRVLHAAATPTLTYLLLVAGLMAIAFEFFQPGFGVAGLSGVLTAGLAVYGLTVLPTRPLMAVLIVIGIALLSVDLAVAGLGVVTLAGTMALAAGSVWLYGGDMALPPWLVVLVVGFAVVFFVGVMTSVLRAQGTQARAGAARVTGKLGVVRSMLNPEGHVFVDGALWRARAPQTAGRVKTGTTVRVTGTSDGLTLDVELLDDAERAPVA